MSNLVVTIHSFVFAFILAASSSPSKADKLPSPPIPPFLQEFFSNNPFFAWVFWLFAALAIGVAAVAALTGNLQKIIDFVQKNLLRKQAEVPEEKRLKLREQLLTRLQSDISIRRQNSLHNLIKIDLEMEEQRHRVGGINFELVAEDTENSNPLNRVFQFFHRDERQTTQLKPNQKIIEFFNRNDIEGKLLILGEPGAGKTTELLSLTQDLIQRAIKDENAPIPIIFELSTWKHDQPIRDWLIEQLSEIYKGIPKAIAKYWIDNQQLIPLLDGLDELGLERENKCIVALNDFLASSFQPGLVVVCCRREEYEQAQNKLEKLNGAIYLQPLSDDQIQQYLQSLRRSSIWNNTIINEPSLLELCRKPLFLTMLVVAYQGRAIKNSSELFEAYIKKQLNNPDLQGTYPPGKSPSQKRTLHYLIWLARKLEAEREPEFLIEGMQPTWLESTKQRIIYRVFVGLIVGLSSGLIFGLMKGLSSGLMEGLIFGLIVGLSYGLMEGLIFGRGNIIPVEKLNFSFKKAMNSLIYGLMGVLMGGLIYGLIFGLSSGLMEGLIGGLIYGLIFGLSYGLSFWLIGGRENIIPVEKLNFSFKKAMNSLIYGLMVGLMVGLIFGLMIGLMVWLIAGLMEGLSSGLMEGLIGGLSFGLMVGLMVGLIFGLMIGLISSEIKNKNFPNQGIWNSLKNGLMVGLIIGLISWLIAGLSFGLSFGLMIGLSSGLNYGLIFGLMGGLTFGLLNVIQHFTLRLILYRNGDIPWNYAKFLDHAVKHRFIQRVGGRYRFMHDLLRKHFAQMPLS